MYKFHLILLFSIISICISSSYAQKLSFKEDGTLKIAQFTDTHYVHGDSKSDTTILNIKRVLDYENPDLVIFTGDIVTGRPVKEGWDAITALVIERKIPFAVTLGNHDDENGVTRSELEEIISSYPYNLNYSTRTLFSGVMDNSIPVYGSDKDMQVKAVIYCFDSASYSTIDDVKGYGWINSDIIEQYKKQSLHYTLKNNYKPLPSLTYFHIPLPEYRYAYNDETNKRFGQRMEDECAPELNSGMFLAMKEMGDVMAVFTGHDHVNNYIVNYKGIALAYGQFSGWKTTYTPKINGARIVVMKEDERKFDSWIRLLDGSVINSVTFPDNF